MLAEQHTCDSAALNEDLDFIRRLVTQGGPQADDAPRFTSWLMRLDVRRREGRLDDNALRAIRDAFGNAMSSVTMQGFAWCKPHGYAGDYEIIDRIYTGYLAEAPHTNWDRYWQSQPAAVAVRNRKAYFHRLLSAVAEHGPASVLKVASGPGRSMYEWLQANPDAPLHIECIDIDPKAVDYARQLNARHAEKLRFHCMNALQFRPERQYQLIWSAGLFDYFSDAIFVRLLRRLLSAVAPDGELVVGNFAPSNPSRAYMALMSWHLIHRSADALRGLALKAGARADEIHVGQEEAGVNLFLHVRPGSAANGAARA